MSAPQTTPSLPHVSWFSPLICAYIDGVNWSTHEEFDFASQVLERIIRVPVGFVTNFASVPRGGWAILSPTAGPGKNNYGKSTAVHDYLYSTPGYCTREEADRVLLEALEAEGVDLVIRDAMYEAVRLFGGSHYTAGKASDQ